MTTASRRVSATVCPARPGRRFFQWPQHVELRKRSLPETEPSRPSLRGSPLRQSSPRYAVTRQPVRSSTGPSKPAWLKDLPVIDMALPSLLPSEAQIFDGAGDGAICGERRFRRHHQSGARIPRSVEADSAAKQIPCALRGKFVRRVATDAAAATGDEHEQWHPATMPELARANRLRHAQGFCGLRARDSGRKLVPELMLHFPSKRRRSR